MKKKLKALKSDNVVVQNEENETNNVQQNQPQQSERLYSNQSKLKTVPQKKSTRNYNSEERNVRMNQPQSKSNGKNVVTMNQTSQSYSGYESSKCAYSNHEYFQIHKISRMN